MLDTLLQIIKKTVPLSPTDIELCRQKFEPVLVPKNRLLEEESNIPKYLYFVISGYVRLFNYDTDGNENTSHFNCPPGFITSYHHFIHQTKSNENVETVTDCELLRISKNNLDTLITQSAAVKDFSIYVLQQSMTYNENRSKELATLSAEQRYLNLIDNYPGILHNVPLQYIASFLGMNAKSLSRIRGQIIK
ncbi:MAG: Crp/Fnr family transcriptional regulator [Bacteroidetes bacterium]|nr:Crp/Fnr family transcriptional regulator [Bacteroidota bacterium]